MLPAPKPWMPLNSISWIMSWAIPDRADPARKMITPTNRTHFRPYISENLPIIGMLVVEASIYAVKTQANWSNPPRSPTTLGRAVATMVWSNDARSKARSMPSTLTRTRVRGSWARLDSSTGNSRPAEVSFVRVGHKILSLAR